MDRERIEISPGHWIEITPKIRGAACARKRDRILATLEGGTARALHNLVVRRRKYSNLLLDEGLELAKKIGLKKAAQKLEIHYETLVSHNRIRRLELGIRKLKIKGTRYTLAQKLVCVNLALELMASKETKEMIAWGKRKYTTPKWTPYTAFIEAGRRLGMNGRSIHLMWNQGDFSATQQPSK